MADRIGPRARRPECDEADPAQGCEPDGTCMLIAGLAEVHLNAAGASKLPRSDAATSGLVNALAIFAAQGAVRVVWDIDGGLEVGYARPTLDEACAGGLSTPPPRRAGNTPPPARERTARSPAGPRGGSKRTRRRNELRARARRATRVDGDDSERDRSDSSAVSSTAASESGEISLSFTASEAAADAARSVEAAAQLASGETLSDLQRAAAAPLPNDDMEVEDGTQHGARQPAPMHPLADPALRAADVPPGVAEAADTLLALEDDTAREALLRRHPYLLQVAEELAPRGKQQQLMDMIVRRTPSDWPWFMSDTSVGHSSIRWMALQLEDPFQLVDRRRDSQKSSPHRGHWADGSDDEMDDDVEHHPKRGPTRRTSGRTALRTARIPNLALAGLASASTVAGMDATASTAPTGTWTDTGGLSAWTPAPEVLVGAVHVALMVGLALAIVMTLRAGVAAMRRKERGTAQRVRVAVIRADVMASGLAPPIDALAKAAAPSIIGVAAEWLSALAPVPEALVSTTCLLLVTGILLHIWMALMATVAAMRRQARSAWRLTLMAAMLCSGAAWILAWPLHPTSSMAAAGPPPPPYRPKHERAAALHAMHGNPRASETECISCPFCATEGFRGRMGLGMHINVQHADAATDTELAAQGFARCPVCPKICDLTAGAGGYRSGYYHHLSERAKDPAHQELQNSTYSVLVRRVQVHDAIRHRGRVRHDEVPSLSRSLEVVLDLALGRRDHDRKAIDVGGDAVPPPRPRRVHAVRGVVAGARQTRADERRAPRARCTR